MDRPPADVLDTSAAGPAAIRGGALRVGSYAVGVLLTVGSAAALFRHLGVVDGGRYVTVLALVTIAGGLTDAGLTAIGVREVAVRAPAERARLMRSLLGLRIVLTSLGVAVATAFAAVAGYTSTMVAGTALAGAGLVLQNVQSALAVPLMAELRLTWVAALDLLKQVATVAIILALVVAGASLLPFLAVPIPAGLVIVAATAALLRGHVSLRPSLRPSEWVPLLRETISYAVATAVGVVYFRVAIVIVSLIASERETGYFGASFRILEVLIIVPQLVVGAAFPIFARAAHGDRERLAYGMQRMLDACLIMGVGIALLLCLGAPLAIHVVAGSRFDPAVPILRIQCLALAASFAAATFGYVLLSVRAHRAILQIFSAALLTSAALTIALTLAWDARGAAVATTVVEAGLAISMAIALARSSERLRPSFANVPRIALAASAAAALAAIPGLPVAALVAAAAAVYVGVLFALRAIPKELIVELRRLRRRAAT